MPQKQHEACLVTAQMSTSITSTHHVSLCHVNAVHKAPRRASGQPYLRCAALSSSLTWAAGTLANRWHGLLPSLLDGGTGHKLTLQAAKAHSCRSHEQPLSVGPLGILCACHLLHAAFGCACWRS